MSGHFLDDKDEAEIISVVLQMAELIPTGSVDHRRLFVYAEAMSRVLAATYATSDLSQAGVEYAVGDMWERVQQIRGAAALVPKCEESK